MKIMHVNAESDIDILPVVKKSLNLLGKKTALVSTIQHLHQLDDAKRFLKKNDKQAEVRGQVLGCRVPNLQGFDSVLYIGTGQFHPGGILLKAKTSIITANPITGVVKKADPKTVESAEKRKKGAFVKFLSSDNIGIILSTKSGQRFGSIKKMQGRYKNKNFYLFALDTINLQELENFPFIDCWVNTACPRMQDDFFRTNKTIVNAEDVE